MTCDPPRPPPARGPAIAACVLLLLAAVSACRARGGRGGPSEGTDCADVETLRICWDDGRPRVVSRPVPANIAPPSPMGWRCVGGGAARVCTSRAAAAPAFVCAGDRCEQRHPRMPDDGEWQCSDSAGATVCAGGERAAGVAPAPAPADAGWFCGARRGSEAGARVCVDLSPDFPDGRARAWRCRTLYDGPTRRVCQRDDGAHTLAEACDALRPCVDGSRCAEGWCVPERPAPACWLETDCRGGRCRFGSCLREGT